MVGWLPDGDRNASVAAGKRERESSLQNLEAAAKLPLKITARLFYSVRSSSSSNAANLVANDDKFVGTDLLITKM